MGHSLFKNAQYERKQMILNSPGEILLEEFMKPMKICKRNFAKKTSLTAKELDDILSGEKKIDESLAEKFSNVLGGSKKFWLNLQKNYDASIEKESK